MLGGGGELLLCLYGDPDYFLSQEFVCDGYKQCADGSDEGSEEVEVSDHS